MKQKGMVLLMTVLMIAIMSLLMLSQMQSVLLFQRSSVSLNENHQILHEMEDIVLKLISNHSASCVVNHVDPNQLNQWLWQHKGCLQRVQNRVYEYLIADMGTYPCLLTKVNDVTLGSHHWLVSILEKNHVPKGIQIRFSLPATGINPCMSPQRHDVPTGIVSWRYNPESMS